MSDNRIDVKVGASTGELKTGMDQSQSIVKQGVAGMQAPFDQMRQSVTGGMKQMQTGVKSALDGVSSSLAIVGQVAAGLGVILAGGALFKGSVDEFVNLNSEVKKLSTYLGVSMQEAAAFGFAFKRAGVDSDTLNQQLRMLEKQTRTGGDAMVAMAAKVGVNIDFNEGLEKTYLKVLEALSRYKEGHDRNQASIDAFGMRVQISGRQLTVTTEAIEKQSQKLKELGLSFDDVSNDKAKKFKDGLFDVNLQFDAMKYKIGEVAIPALTSLGYAVIWVAEQFRKMMTAESSAEGGIAVLGGLAAPAARKLTYPPQAQPGKTGETHDPPKTGTGGGGGKGGGASLVQQWVAELEQLKAAEEKFQSQSLQMEKAFWAKKLATGKVATQEELEALKSKEHESEAVRLKAEADFWKGKLLLTSEGTKEYQEVHHKILTLEQQQNKLRLQSEIELIKSKIKAGQDAIKDKMALIEHENQLEKLNLEMKQANVAHLAKMGAMNRVQELRAYKALKKEEHEIDLKAAQEKALAEKGDLKAYQKHLKDISLLKKKQALELKKIDFDITQAMKEQWGQVWSAVSQAFSMSVQGIITGTTTLADALKNIGQSILTSLAGMFLQMALEYIAAKIMMLIFGKAADDEMALSQIGAQAGVAGAAGVASVMVAVPFPANIALAPKIGAAAAAMAASFGILASAAGGWDVPHDTLAMVHKDEKILPADWPQKLRAVAAPAGGGAVGPTRLTLHLKNNVVTPDGRTLLKENKTMFFDLTNQGIAKGEIRIPAPRRR
jgi:hypothetical protein